LPTNEEEKKNKVCRCGCADREGDIGQVDVDGGGPVADTDGLRVADDHVADQGRGALDADDTRG
jgi:hypothetical protein